MTTLTKANIIKTICNKLGITKAKSAQVTETLQEIIKRTLANGEDVLVSGFGKFCVHDKKPRQGRNPHTGDDITLRPRRTVQ